MASISLYSPPYSSSHRDAVSLPRRYFCAATFKTSFFASNFPVKPLSFSKQNASKLRPKDVISASTHTFDVVIVGAGIVGLTIARQFLIGSDLSVAVVDKAVPCSGATGAGQGYIWMVHKSPESDTWELTMRSHELWAMLAESIHYQGLNPLDVLGWKRTGSLLVGRNPEESESLKRRVKQLSEAGLRAEYLSSHDLLLEEPALEVGENGGAVFLPDDCQLDAQRTVAFIEKTNRQFASKGRYAEFYHDPVMSLLRSSSNGEVEAVQTSKNTLYSRKAIIVAAGCWSGSLMHGLFRESDPALNVPVKPRKGYLLVLENFHSLKLNHGVMEAGYVDHYGAGKRVSNSASGLVDHGGNLSVSMTATMDSIGNLVLVNDQLIRSIIGSLEPLLLALVTIDGVPSQADVGRQFSGFNTEVDESIVGHIWNRAGEFFPKLKELSLSDFTMNRKLRVGLRPYMPDGKPLIGPLPNFKNVIIATGHEGGGLSMALGTAEMVADMVLGNPGLVDYSPFAVQDRCC